jgi:hypothetical protein
MENTNVIKPRFRRKKKANNEQRRRVEQMTARNARVRRERQNREKRIRRSMLQDALRELEDKVERQHKLILKQQRQLVTNKTKTSQRKGTCFILLFFSDFPFALTTLLYISKA